MSNEKLEVLSVQDIDFIQSLFQDLFPSTKDLFVFYETNSKDIHIDIGVIVGKHNTILFTMGMSLHQYYRNGKRSYEMFTIVPNNWFKVNPGNKHFFDKPISKVLSKPLLSTINLLIQFARNKLSNESLYEDGITLTDIKIDDKPFHYFIMDNYKVILKDESELHLLFAKLAPKINKDIKYVDELNREFINNLISYMIEQ